MQFAFEYKSKMDGIILLLISRDKQRKDKNRTEDQLINKTFRIVTTDCRIENIKNQQKLVERL
jgi:hypothetical protein